MEYFYSHIAENDLNRDFIDALRNYAEEVKEQIYLLQHPLTDSKYSYEVHDVGIVLMRKHKIAFVSFKKDNRDQFEDYKTDVLEDINSLSDTYGYRNLVGRVRKWENEITISCFLDKIDDYIKWIKRLELHDENQYRRLELIITLFIGSINDVSNLSLEKSTSIIERVKQKIQVFDGEQTRFIYGDYTGTGKQIIVQGLSGTGKTELLLHKLREIYLTDPQLPIGFTCHNKILADSLRKRIPDFFNFMKVKKQIEWDKLLCVNAWGQSSSITSGIYRYICNYYDIPFWNFRQCGSFNNACKKAIEELKSIKIKNNFAFSYIFIDESQDFDDSFFTLCEMVTEHKVFIAGDIFQSIFEENAKTKRTPTLLLSNCYRTDPKTLMIAHALGLGLYEKKKLWWLKEEEWKQCGYIVEKKEDVFSLTRYPLHRFDDDNDEFRSFEILRTDNFCNGIKKILIEIKEEFPNVSPEDIGIIYIDDESYIYDLSSNIVNIINMQFEWKTNVAYETKHTAKDSVFISNRNNVKGLEFPIVICITKKIHSTISYRNTLYTMLTRSFIRSYLLIEKGEENGLTAEILQGIRMTLRNKKIEVTAPTQEETQDMLKWFEGAKRVESLAEKLKKVFKELNINDMKVQESILAAINIDKIKNLDYEKLKTMVSLMSSMI